MGTTGLVDGTDAGWALVGALPALVVVACLGGLLLTAPPVGFFGLVAVGILSAGGGYLVFQQREAVTSMQRDLGQRRFQTGSTGGVLGAWVGGASGEKNARRHRIAVALTWFVLTLGVGSFGTLFAAGFLLS